nr:9953_t:CDS:2 [Entrophospora candida]
MKRRAIIGETAETPSSSLVKRVFAQCSSTDGTFPMTFDSFVITPDPVVIGQDASLSFSGTTTAPIETGTTYSLVSTIDGVEYPSEGDFCTTFNQTCPVAAGAFTFTGNYALPEAVEEPTTIDQIYTWCVSGNLTVTAPPA